MKMSLSLALLFALLTACLPFKVAAKNIDGVLDEKEWKSVQPTVIVSDSDIAGCDIESGIAYIFCDDSADKIYIGFKVKLSQDIKENSSYGVAVSVDSGEFVNITPNGISAYDADKFSVEAKVCGYSDAAFSAEVIVGVKHGLTTADSIRVRFIDADGVPSNVYTVKVPYITMSDSDSLQTQQSADGYNGPSESKSDKTTVAKNTAPKTTKPKSSKPKTTKEYDDTTSAVADFDGIGQTSPQINDVSQEDVTVLTVKQMKLQKGFTYAAVAALIILALGICVAVNLARDKVKGEKSDKK